jgi:hypothetical protein
MQFLSMRNLPPFWLFFPFELLCETSLLLWKRFKNQDIGNTYEKAATAILHEFWKFSISLRCAEARYSIIKAKYHKIKGNTYRACKLCFSIIEKYPQNSYEVALAKLLLTSMTRFVVLRSCFNERSIEDASTILIEAQRTFVHLKCSKEIKKCRKLVLKVSVNALESPFVQEPGWDSMSKLLVLFVICKLFFLYIHTHVH